MSNEIRTKDGDTIKISNRVSTPYRGGEHVGQVEEIATTTKEAKNLSAKGASNLPAVALHDQNDKKVTHKPRTLTDLSKKGD